MALLAGGITHRNCTLTTDIYVEAMLILVFAKSHACNVPAHKQEAPPHGQMPAQVISHEQPEQDFILDLLT